MTENNKWVKDMKQMKRCGKKEHLKQSDEQNKIYTPQQNLHDT